MTETKKRRKKHKPAVTVTPAILDAVFKALAAGTTLSEFCRQPGQPTRCAVAQAIGAGGPEVTERFTEAREMGYDAMAEQVIAIVDLEVPKDKAGRTDAGLVQQRRLQADVRLRLLAKWSSARYGDRVVHAGDPAAPLNVMSDAQAMAEIMGMLATAKARQLKDPANRLN